MFYFILLLTLLAPVQVFGYDVNSWLTTGSSSHVFFPRSSSKNKVTKEVKTESETRSFKIICEEFEIDDPRIGVYTNEGVLFETGTIISSSPCSDANIANYIVPQESENNNLEIIYLIEGKNPICIKRSYKISTSSKGARVKKSNYPVVPCPSKVTQFTQSASGQAGGLVSLGPTRMHVFSIHRNVKDKKEPQKIDFPTKDLKGKTFTMICDKLEGGSVSATIVHEDWQDVVIEEFKIDACSLDYININRQIFHNTNRFKTVFRAPRGICYEREYKFYDESNLFYYNTVSIERTEPEKVHCPEKYTGDIGENEYRPWFEKLFTLFAKYESYAVVVSDEST